MDEQEQQGAAEQSSASQTAAGASGETKVERGLVGVARGEDVSIRQSMAGVVTGRKGAELRQGMALALVSGGETHLRQGMAVALPSLGDVHVQQAGVQWVVSAGDVSFEKGGCAAAVAPSVTVNNGGIGVALAWKMNLGDGVRVLLTARTAAIAGLALGIGCGVAAGLTAVAGGARLMARRG